MFNDLAPNVQLAAITAHRVGLGHDGVFADLGGPSMIHIFELVAQLAEVLKGSTTLMMPDIDGVATWPARHYTLMIYLKSLLEANLSGQFNIWISDLVLVMLKVILDVPFKVPS